MNRSGSAGDSYTANIIANSVDARLSAKSGPYYHVQVFGLSYVATF